MAADQAFSLGSIIKDKSKGFADLANEPHDGPLLPTSPATTAAPVAPKPATQPAVPGIAPPTQAQSSNSGGGISMADIVNRPTAAPPTPPAAPTPPDNGSIIGSQITAKTGTVSGDMLAQEQLRRITDENGPLMQQAAARAAQTANSRGMMNSSLAAQSGQEAMIASATPFALQDASTHFTNQRDNLAAENQFSLADKSSQLQDVLQGRDLSNRYTIAREGNAAQIQSASIGAGAQVSSAYIRAQVDREQLAQNGSQFAATMGFNRDENAANRTQQSTMQNNAQNWQGGQNQLSRDATRDESAANRSWQAGQNAQNQSWQGTQNWNQQNWQSGQNTQAQNAQAAQNTQQQNWQGNQNTQQQNAQAVQNTQNQTWQGNQNAQNQSWQGTQNWNQQNWQGNQNQLSQANSVTLAGMNIDANARTNAASLGNATFQSWSNAHLSIDSNTNMTAADKLTAKANLDTIYFANPNMPVKATPGAYKPTTPPPPPAPAPPAPPAPPGTVDPVTGLPFTLAQQNSPQAGFRR